MMRRQGRRTWAAIAVAGFLVLAMAGAAPAGTSTKVKAAAGDKFKPVHKYVGKGTTVSWKNTDNTRHDISAFGGGWSYSADLQPGQASPGRKFKKLGTFRYRCVIHSGIVDGKCEGMCGFVHVLPD